MRCSIGSLVFLVALALWLAMCPSSSASAQREGTDSSDPAALFRLGKERYAEGKFEEAYAAYKKAFEIQPAFDVAGNLGNVELKLGKYRDAVIHLRYVLANLPPSYAPERRDEIVAHTKRLLEEARRHVAVVKLVLEPTGALVTLNGERLGTTPLADELVLDAGKHRLVVSHDGYQTLTHELDVQAGASETIRMSLALAGDPSPGTVDGDSGAKEASAGPIWPLVIAGGVVGLGALGAGIGLHVAAGAKADEREEISGALPDGHCLQFPNDPSCPAITELADEESTLSAAGTAMLVVGGVVVAATAVYLGVTLAGSGDDGEARLELVPAAGPELTGAVVRGRF